MVDVDTIQNKQQKYISQGGLTNSKFRSAFCESSPTHLVSGVGAYVKDIKGKEFIDMICGLGSISIGHSNPQILAAVSKQLYQATSLSLPSPIEVEAAEYLLTEFLTQYDAVKYLKTGAEACAGAIKIARGYHGVRYSKEDMHKMSEAFEYFQFSQRPNQKRWTSESMQNMHKDLSIPTSCDSDKALGAVQILEDGKRQDRGEKALSEATREEQTIKSKNCLLPGETTSNENAMPGLWSEDKNSSAPRRLYEALRSLLGLPTASCRYSSPKRLILSDHYHGHLSEFIGLLETSFGIIKDPFILSLTGNEDLIPEAAAVIIEPIVLDHSENNTKKLFELKKLCNENNTLLIFDEIVCGTRIPEVFISNIIQPDLVCIGKGIANGFPLSAIIGKKDLMHETPFFISSTFAGETLSLTAHLQTMKFIKNNPPKHLYESALRVMKKAQELLKPIVQLNGYGTRGFFEGNFGLMQQEGIKSKLLFGKSWFYSYAHQEIEKIIISALEDMASSLSHAKLEGREPRETFKRA